MITVVLRELDLKRLEAELRADLPAIQARIKACQEAAARKVTQTMLNYEVTI